MRKPVEERRSSPEGSGALTATEEAIDGLVEFFTSLSTQVPALGHPEGVHGTQAASSSVTAHPTTNTNLNDIQELEDMGALARDLIRRIQRLRDQFRPGSLAALALPAIRLEGEDDAANTGIGLAHWHPQAHAVNEHGHILMDPATLAADPADEDDNDEDQLDGPESSTD